MIKTIILDFDGLIIDTETLNYTVTKEAYSQFGVTLTLDLWRQVFLETSEIQHQVITEHSIQKINYDQVGQLRAEKFRAGISNLQICPGALAFEDSPIGAKAAKCAGIKCVVVPNFVTEELVFEDTDYQLSSMLDMNIEELLKRLR